MVACYALAELVKHYPLWRYESLPEDLYTIAPISRSVIHTSLTPI
jgi:hypothetical protein